MKFIATYQMPHEGFDAWMQLPENERKAQEVEMQSQWNAWMAQHTDVQVETVGVGKPKRITKDGIEDARNGIMMYSIVEAESLEEAAEIFSGHQHFGIPGGVIEVMSVKKDIS